MSDGDGVVRVAATFFFEKASAPVFQSGVPVLHGTAAAAERESSIHVRISMIDQQLVLKLHSFPRVSLLTTYCRCLNADERISLTRARRVVARLALSARKNRKKKSGRQHRWPSGLCGEIEAR